jgi:ATP-dependent RNA helicase RhlE
VCVDEQKLLRDIERLLKRKIMVEAVAGYEPDLSIKAEPIKNGRGQRGFSKPRNNRNGGSQQRGGQRSGRPNQTKSRQQKRAND